jgi:aspartate/tyrosine/aromatic aminotransferase
LAITKEMLASVRGKYSSVPIPGAEVTTNATELRSEGASEKQALIEELKTMLEESSRIKYMEREAQISQNTQDILTKVPYPIYIY